MSCKFAPVAPKCKRSAPAPLAPWCARSPRRPQAPVLSSCQVAPQECQAPGKRIQGRVPPKKGGKCRVPAPTPSYLVWQGPSEIDGAPIAVVMTGVGRRKSRNTKTGPLAQVFILPQALSPADSWQLARELGIAHSVCGGCLHFVLGTCYVDVTKSVNQVWQVWQDLPPLPEDWQTDQGIRLGAWGDPGALPLHVVENLVARSRRRRRKSAGYTHRWRERPDLAKYCMASCDTPLDRVLAEAAGFRPFMTTAPGAPAPEGLTLCPASSPDSEVQCADCMLCYGTQDGGDLAGVYIPAHGPKVRPYLEWLAAWERDNADLLLALASAPARPRV